MPEKHQPNAKSSDIEPLKLYSEETQKALHNFQLSQLTMPSRFIQALGQIKSACALANADLQVLDKSLASYIQQAADEVAQGLHNDQFPVDVMQTGSGTSTNMNANEVIATLVKMKSAGNLVAHPNDDVNMGQSSNDVIPTAIHLSAAIAVHNELLPALEQLIAALNYKANSAQTLIKTGRTHLMDAMPLSVAQEMSGWSAQISTAKQQLSLGVNRLCDLAIGGTAVGTGVNTLPTFADKVCHRLSQQTGIAFKPADNYFRAISSQDSAVFFSGLLKNLAISLSKITNDIRWYSSGPETGLNEIQLAEMQKGSSIMPGKVNPVIPESILMACTQVIGNDTTISLAGHSGNFQLNTMLPLIAYNLLQSITLVASSSLALADKVIATMQFNKQVLADNLERNPILATALNRIVGYDKAAEIAKKAYAEHRPVLDVAAELTELSPQELAQLLSPAALITNQKD
ncbi:class II fumarate hydratase [Colwellia sp. MEBiC06753]